MLTNNIIIKLNIYRLVKYIFFTFWTYWLIIAIFSPVTLWDANAYNIARLEILIRGGFFNNLYFNDFRQIAYPWVFDAVHLPFRKLGYLENIPSYLCFTGILIIIYRYIDENYTRLLAWLSVLSLFSMPCLVYQSVSTKPDIAVAFGFSVYFYALYRKNNINETLFYFISILSLCFILGCRPIYFPLTFICALFTFFKSNIKYRIYIILSFILLFILFGSIETYLNNKFIFDNFTGPRTLDGQGNFNQDGLKGAIAVFIRHVFANTNLGIDSFFYFAQPITHSWERICGIILNKLHLTNLGMMHQSLVTDDNNLMFLKENSENNSDYSILGSLGIWSIIIIPILLYRKIDIPWLFYIFGVLFIFNSSLIMGWSLYCNRYLCSPFISFAIGLLIIIHNINNSILLKLFSILIVSFCVFTIMCSFNKGPNNLLDMLINRSLYQVKENPWMQPIVESLNHNVTNNDKKKLLLIAGLDAWVLPVLSNNKYSIDMLNNRIGITKMLENKRYDFILFLRFKPQSINISNYKLIKIFENRVDRGVPDTNSFLYLSNN